MRAPLFALLLVLASVARAAPPKDEFADPDPVILVKTLRARAEEWWKARKAAVVQCNRCKGSGRLIIRGSVQTCPWCGGGKRMFQKEQCKVLLYDMRSPAFRALPNSRELASDEWMKLDDDGRFRPIRKHKIHRVQLVDLSHGVVSTIEDDDSVARPQEWIWALDPTSGRSDWWTYTGRIDGAWPTEAEPIQADKSSPLLGKELAALRESLVAAAPTTSVRSAAVAGRTLILRLAPEEDAKYESLPIQQVEGRFLARAMEQIRTTGQAVFGASPRFEAMRWEFLSPWRDRFGVEELRPWLTAWMRRSWFQRIVWNNLNQSERVELFEPQWLKHEGWIPWWRKPS